MQNIIRSNKKLNTLSVIGVLHLLVFGTCLITKIDAYNSTLLFSLSVSIYLLALFPFSILFGLAIKERSIAFWLLLAAYIVSHSGYALALLFRLVDVDTPWLFYVQISAIGIFLVILNQLIKKFDNLSVKLFLFSSIFFYSSAGLI